MTSDPIQEMYKAVEGGEVLEEFARRHGIVSREILTVMSMDIAAGIAAHLAARVEGKTVIEIGGGIGLLSLCLGEYAKRVWCIEANPVWSWIFLMQLIHGKPKNVSFLFGAADEFVGTVKGDVAIFATHSGVDAMRATAATFAPEVIDIYGEMIAAAPEKFDPIARELRKIV